MGLKLWSGIITSDNYIRIKIKGCGVSNTNIGLFGSGGFGSIRVLFVGEFKLSEMVDKLTIGRSEGGRVFSGGIFCAGVFCVESFKLSEIGE